MGLSVLADRRTIGKRARCWLGRDNAIMSLVPGQAGGARDRHMQPMPYVKKFRYSRQPRRQSRGSGSPGVLLRYLSPGIGGPPYPMWRLITRVLPLAAAILLHSGLACPALAGIDPRDEARILRTTQIHAGMQGYGLTVFRGDAIERFDVKVLGVLPLQNSGRPLILVRVGGGVLTTREVNIAEGMSGSPVYIGGKLIGAVAYAGSFAREPLGLVTPIEDMLEAWDPTLPAIPPGFGEIQPLPKPVSVGGATLRAIGFRPGAVPASPEGPGAAEVAGQAWFSPMATPVIAAGFSQRTLAMAGAELGQYSLNVMQGPGRMSGRQIALREGSAVGFSLATGDVDMTGVGTVTYRRGDSILAFGHPFLTMGAIGMPMSTCWVHDVFPSYSASFKLASPASIVGASTQDRPFSMAGAVGKSAEMVPVQVTVRDDRSASPLRFRANVLKHPIVTPMITRMVAAEAVGRKRPYPGEGMARVTTTVTGKGVGAVTRTNVFFSPGDIAAEATGDLSEILGLFQANKFHPIPAEKVTMEVELFQTRQTAEVERIMLDRAVFEPGEVVDVAVQMKPYRADPVIRHVRVKIPESAVDGRAILAVQGGSEASGAPPAQATAGVMVADKPGLPEDLKDATTLQQLFSRYQELSRNNELVTRLLMSSASFSIEGERLTGFPPGMEYAMQSKKATGVRMVRDEARVREDTDWFVTGTQVLPITIQKKSHSEKASGTTSTSSTTTSQPATSSESSTSAVKAISVTDDEMSMMPAPLAPQAGGELLPRNGTSAGPGSESDESDEASASSSENGDAASDDTTTESSSDATKSEKDENAKLADLGHTSQTWRQGTAADFLKGEMSGVAVGSAAVGTAASQSEGSLRPGVEVKQLASLDQPYVWSVCPGLEQAVIAGTGNKGAVYRIRPDGTATTLFSVSGSQALAVLRDRRGQIWAGSSPDGAVWLYADGKAAKVAQTPAKHVSALALGPEDSVLAGAGDGGQIWRVTPEGGLRLFADTHQLHVQCLWTSADGSVLAGTARNAAVWTVSEGRAEAILNTAEEFVGGVVANGKGVVFATTGPRGKLYRLEKGKAPVVLVDKLASVTTPLALGSDGAVVAADASRIYWFPEAGGQVVQQLDSQRDFQTMAATDAGGIAAGIANGGSVWRFAPASAGWYESAVRDAERPASWGAVRADLSGAAPGVQMKVRSGDVAEPDRTWSGWTPVTPGGSVALKGPRYLQYRVEFASPVSSDRIANVAFSYLAANRPPAVKFQKPANGSALSGTQEITWSGSDPDSDKLTYELSYSADGGTTWSPIGKVSAKPSEKKTPEDKPNTKDEAKPAGETATPKDDSGTNDLLAQTKKALDARPDIPAAMRERMLATAQKAIERSKAARAEDAAGKDSGEKVNGTSHKWDTTKVSDGRYLLRVTASDVLANSSDALTAQAHLGPLLVTNAKPVLTLSREPVAAAAGKDARLRGVSRSKMADIAAVQFRLEGSQDWYSAEADDGLFDSPEESFTCVVRGLKAGKHKLEVRAKDSAGNVSTAERQFETKAAASPKPDGKPGAS